MKISQSNISKTISEKILGLEPWDCGFYWDPEKQLGLKCPDFLGDPAARNDMVQAMRRAGFEHERTIDAPNPASGVGQTFTCRFARPYRSGEATHPDEGFACCLAALKALGIDVVANGA